MAKINIDSDEWYPVYSVIREGGSIFYDERDALEVDEETVARWERVAAEFDAVQRELSAMRSARSASEA